MGEMMPEDTAGSSASTAPAPTPAPAQPSTKKTRSSSQKTSSVKKTSSTANATHTPSHTPSTVIKRDSTHSSLRPVTDLVKEGIEFGQLTRPSRLQILHLLMDKHKMNIKEGKMIPFLVRPINCGNLSNALPKKVTVEQVCFAFKWIGIKGDDCYIAQLHCKQNAEFIVLLPLAIVRPIPQQADPIIRVPGIEARNRFNIAIPPLLIEHMDASRVTPSYLFHINVGFELMYQFPQDILDDIRSHTIESKRIITQVLDDKFNTIKYQNWNEYPLVNFKKSNHLEFRDSNLDNGITSIEGMNKKWANVIIDWKKVLYSKVDCYTEGFPLNSLFLEDDAYSRRHKFEIYNCKVCFGESKLCQDKTGNCRFLMWGGGPCSSWTACQAA